tara:strand:- start:504 stop:758 length:255 start_codon:yes stop_codon:yes gene_type:complete
MYVNENLIKKFQNQPRFIIVDLIRGLISFAPKISKAMKVDIKSNRFSIKTTIAKIVKTPKILLFKLIYLHNYMREEGIYMPFSY